MRTPQSVRAHNSRRRIDSTRSESDRREWWFCVFESLASAMVPVNRIVAVVVPFSEYHMPVFSFKKTSGAIGGNTPVAEVRGSA
jgi:hypothetical protein